MAAGDLDTSFGTGGKVSVDFGSISIANAVVVQGNQDLVLAGRVGDASTGDFGVARLNSNGSLDTTFGTGGKVVIPFTSEEDVARAVAIQTDGKIVVGGFAGSEAAGDVAVARLNTDGSLDTTFADGARKESVPIGNAGHVFRSVRPSLRTGPSPWPPWSRQRSTDDPRTRREPRIPALACHAALATRRRRGPRPPRPHPRPVRPARLHLVAEHAR